MALSCVIIHFSVIGYTECQERSAQPSSESLDSQATPGPHPSIEWCCRVGSEMPLRAHPRHRCRDSRVGTCRWVSSDMMS